MEKGDTSVISSLKCYVIWFTTCWIITKNVNKGKNDGFKNAYTNSKDIV